MYNDYLIGLLIKPRVGTGYLTACFALMVGPEGRTVGVEHIPELVASSIKNIQKSAAASLLEGGSLSVHVGGMYFESRFSSTLKNDEASNMQILFRIKLVNMDYHSYNLIG